MRRTRVWTGGSTLASVGTAPQPPSSSAFAAIRQGGESGALALTAEKVGGSRKICLMSRWRVTIQCAIECSIKYRRRLARLGEIGIGVVEIRRVERIEAGADRRPLCHCRKPHMPPPNERRRSRRRFPSAEKAWEPRAESGRVRSTGRLKREPWATASAYGSACGPLGPRAFESAPYRPAGIRRGRSGAL